MPDRFHLFVRCVAVSALLLGAIGASAASGAARKAPLKVEVFTAGDSGYSVTSAIIYGPKDAVLVDAQFTYDDANRLGDRIASLGRKLTAIFVTHPDADHFIGLAPLHARFPQAQIYMTPEGIAGYRQDIDRIRADFARSKSRVAETPPVEPIAKPLSGNALTVDGQRVEIIPDLQGDIMFRKSNSVVWVPSASTLIAGDMAFDKVHLWLDKSTPEIRAAWSKGLARLQALKPHVLVAGHRGDPSAALDPAILQADRNYLARFEAAVASNRSADALEKEVTAAYPGWAHPLFLKLAARSQFPAPAK